MKLKHHLQLNSEIFDINTINHVQELYAENYKMFMKESQHLGLGNNKYVKRLKNNIARQSKPQAKRVARGRSYR